MSGWDYVSTLSLDTSGYDQQLNNAVKSTKEFKEEAQRTDNELKKLKQEGDGIQKTFQDFAEKMGMSKDSALKFGKELKDLTVIGGTFAAGLGAVKIGLDAAITGMKSTQAGAEEYNRIQSSLNETVDYFWESLAKGDISSFISNLDKVIAKASQARTALIQLNNFNKFGQLQDESLRSRKTELEMRIQADDVTSEELNAIADELGNIANKLEKNANTRQNFAEAALNKTLDAYLAKILTYEGIKEAGLSVEELKNEAKRIIREDAETSSKWASMSDGEIVGNYRTLKTSTIQGGVMGGTTMTSSEYSTNKSVLSKAALQYLFGELAASNNGDILGLFEQAQGKNDAGFNEARDARNIIKKDIPEKLDKLRQTVEDNGKSNPLFGDNKVNTALINEIKTSFKPFINSNSVSGFNNTNRMISHALHSLNNSQLTEISKLYTSFEDSMTELDKRFLSGQLSDNDYNKQSLKLQRDLISSVKGISPEFGSYLNEILLYDNITATDINEVLDTVDQQLGKYISRTLYEYSDKSKSQINGIISALYNSVSFNLSQMLKRDNTGVYPSIQLVDNSAWVNPKSDITEEYQKIYKIYEKFKQEYATLKQQPEYLDDLTNDIFTDNIRTLEIVLKQLEQIRVYQDELSKKPLVDLGISKEQMQNAEYAMQSMQSIATGLDNISSESNKLGGFSKMAALAATIFGLITQLQKCTTVWEYIAAASAGFATITAAFSSLQSFSSGGIFEGATSMGDYNIARVNDGEMILNSTQQGRLFRMLNSGNPEHKDNMNGNVTFKIQGTELVGVLKNHNKIYNKFNR